MYVERRNVDGFYNLCKRKQIFMVMFLMIGSCVQISIATSDSCPVSPSTVEIVESCPDSKEKWREAAARKNCGGIDSQCDDQDRLVYHCVINAFVNQTLEVCAYRRIIAFGFCTEYNFGGNRIQQNYRGDCSKFTQNPCPSLYPSTDAYKYPGCYEMTKKTTVGPATMTVTTLSTEKATHMNNENQPNEGLSTGMMVMVLVLVVLVLIFAVFILYIMWRKRIYSRFRKKDHSTIYEVEHLPLRAPDTATVDSEADNLNVAPSGQSIGNGDKMKKIQIVEEEDLPEYFLKPEETPEKDCQTLLSLLNDGFERLAVISSENSNADNQPNLQNLHHEYYDPELRISQESTQILKKDLAQVQSLIEYFKISKKKQGVCKE